jgi:hypothetical protein
LNEKRQLLLKRKSLLSKKVSELTHRELHKKKSENYSRTLIKQLKKIQISYMRRKETMRKTLSESEIEQ